MGIFLGLDVGSVSAKLAAISTSPEHHAYLNLAADSREFSLFPSAGLESTGRTALTSQYRRIHGSPSQTVTELLDELQRFVPPKEISGIRVTGSGGRLVAHSLRANFENEFRAIARGTAELYPQVRTVLEMGGENSKYIRLADGSAPSESCNGNRQGLGIVDYATSGECAAGTGSFLDQQATRLLCHVEEIGEIVRGAQCAARIAGRCSVFAKSDMIHAQQKGYGTDEILKGLCEAVARNMKSSLVRGRPLTPPVAFIGGVAQNSAVVEALRTVFHLHDGQIFVPELHSWLGAIGAALLESESTSRAGIALKAIEEYSPQPAALFRGNVNSACPPLSMENVLLLRERVQPYELSTRDMRIPAYLGIDIGSVSTNLALLDEDGRLMHSIYLYTAGRPIEIVNQGMQELKEMFGDRVEIRGVGTTGSGRELIGELTGADTVNDEITAHKTGALYVHRTMVQNTDPGGGEVDTIFEIGGQDSKFISIENGVVVDFAMNEACAAGTGSFLEEQAERLGIQIKGEFANLALESEHPARLGERCTVFMERDVTAAMHRGAKIGDLTAGLAYSVALNYLNRVVRGRKIGKVIYFQGGTAYNDAVAAAFASLLGTRIIVPPHNGVIGAIGMALIARDRAHFTGRPSTFRGFDLNKTKYQSREFVCKACSNYCDMKEITVEGRKTYWGDRCSDKFRKRARTDRIPVIEDLLTFRDSALTRAGAPFFTASDSANDKLAIGIPRAMYYFDQFPFWARYLIELGFRVVVSPPTDGQIAAKGVELSVAEPCFPVQVAHGHVSALFDAGADFVLVPNALDREAPCEPWPTATFLCPWNQTLPHVLRAAPAFVEYDRRVNHGHGSAFLKPLVYFRLGPRHVKRQLASEFARLGIRRSSSDAAVDAAYDAQRMFEHDLLEKGREAVAVLKSVGEPAIVLVGRPYNIYDRNANCDIPRKLRDLYGVNILPMDFLPLDEQPAERFSQNMFWHSGRKILSAGWIARQNPNFHLIYISNFKCGPDSFVKHALRETLGVPFLVLQFDGHGNDAGYLTRCEAYLDSKGVLQCALKKAAS
jgi:predicted CoA-substrate-specific enzyme activase